MASRSQFPRTLLHANLFVRPELRRPRLESNSSASLHSSSLPLLLPAHRLQSIPPICAPEPPARSAHLRTPYRLLGFGFPAGLGMPQASLPFASLAFPEP